MEQQIKDKISACDLAIPNIDFDTLMNFRKEDAVLVVVPGMIAQGEWRCASDHSYDADLIGV
ncbi:hypothetical protein P9D84_07185 [Bacillus vallismortis]|nr:hypothetical protein [Bacillus vallismortis]MCY8307694.1 hypothetical protein [Bacillus vallismortis]MCY8535319.1 hypothetical protein [Bacillus vallismortis]MCY8597433.1 hypothetical protein [Bacillus vallismortis]MEC1791180.1 hypothetical protein [Bacillus vallismortis]